VWQMNLKTRHFTGAEILNEPLFAVDESVIADSEDKIHNVRHRKLRENATLKNPPKLLSLWIQRTLNLRAELNNEWQNARRVDIFIYVACKVSYGGKWCGKSKGFLKKFKKNKTDCN